MTTPLSLPPEPATPVTPPDPHALRRRQWEHLAAVVLLDSLLVHEFLISERGWPLFGLVPALAATGWLYARCQRPLEWAVRN